MSEELIKDILTGLAMAEQFKPVVDETMKVVKTYGKELGTLLEAVIHSLVKIRIDTYKAYKAAGMSEDLIMELMRVKIDYKELFSSLPKSINVTNNKGKDTTIKAE